MRRLGTVALVLIGLVVGFGALATQSAVQLAVVNAPSLVFDGQVETDVVFDEATGLALDIYVPATPGPHPVLVFFHGGSWQTGQKDDYPFVGTLFAERGYVVVVPDYRKYPGVRFPAFVEDGGAAVAWVTREIGAYGGDPERIFLTGHSAGGYNAAMLAADERYLEVEGVNPAAIRGVVGFAAPYHFTPKADDMVAIFGPAERYPAMQTGRFVDGREPPFLMLYGDADTTVGRSNIDNMEAAFAETGGCFRTIIYPSIDHIGILSSLSWIFRDGRPVLEDVMAFLEAAEANAVCDS